MNQLNNTVLSIIRDFVKCGTLFTALDVSNAVKNTLPFSKHREVRDMVRSLFTSEIEAAGYARTPITVTLANGSTAEALLYHPLTDSWDLDTKYDAQKREQSIMATSVFMTSQVTNSTQTLGSAQAMGVTNNMSTSPTSNKEIWDNLLKLHQSLFSK